MTEKHDKGANVTEIKPECIEVKNELFEVMSVHDAESSSFELLKDANHQIIELQQEIKRLHKLLQSEG